MNTSPSAREILSGTAARWGLQLSQTQLDQFDCYAEQLRLWNERVNLTTIVEPVEIATRHFLDSLRCSLSWGNDPKRLADLGTGAGFPGLPLKILRPQLHLTLVESIAKKTSFLQHIIAALSLDDVAIITDRAEVLGHQPEHRERYDVVVARAVADLRVLAEYCLPLCRVGGRFLAPKGSQIETEVAAAQHAIATLGGQLLAIEPVELPHVEPRTLLVINKVMATPNHYPRAVGVPAKRPL